MLITAVIIYLSLFNPADVGLENVSIKDKWAHIIMYFGFELILWFDYWKSHVKASVYKVILLGILAPIVFSGCMELAQEYLTDCRSGDWVDLAANAIGVAIGAAVGLTAERKIVTRL